MDSLKLYMDQFSFLGDPLDVAVRKLLMDVTLPRETQQIDRVIEAFAKRYLRCNPDLFTSDDHPYILAFSLIMLHTDAFNKLNKRKMSKADYIKNTSLPGVPPEVLDCFYDNIVFAPFIFIEDALDANNHQGPMLEGATPRVFSAAGTQPPSPLPSGGTTTTLFGRAKIDPYYLITRNLLGPLRVNVEALVPAENPYSHQGTTGPLNGEELLHAFTHAIVIEMGIVDNNRLPSAFFGLNVAGMPSPMLAGVGALPEIPPSTGQVWTLKVTKVGLLNRKDEILEGGKKVSNRKWKPFSVILTKSQLLLFRDTNWAAALLSRTTNVGNRVPYPQTSIFRPDELFSIKDAVAVYDKSYTKHVNAFRLVLADGRHILFQTSDEKELNEWISRINYASTFRSTGVRMRSLGMSGKDVELTGVAAANSHLHDIQRQNHQAQPKVHSFGQRALNDSTDMSSPNNVEEPWRSMQSRRVTMMSGRQDVDLEIPVDPGIEGAYQFKATFDQVKAELAAGYWYSGEPHIVPESGSRPNSEFSVNSPASTPDGDTSRGSSRSQLIRPKVEDLETQLTTKISQLDTNMRFVRNVGIMTPFQKATRDRLQDAVQNTSKKVMQLRLDMARLICHRNVLLNDLAEEERTFHRTKTLALQAATETLQSSSAQNVLRMSFDAQDVTVGESSAAPSPDTPDQSKTESSMCNSLDSALDLGLDWSSSVEDMAALHFLNASHETDSPVTEGGCSSIGHGELNMSGRMIGRTSSDPATLVDQGGRDSQTELAEEWNKTRAAKRVSLVRLPTDFRVPTLLGKQHRPGEDGISTVVEDVASRW
ncbi:hypothetical protein SERLA73DRAFT_91578 [Serpula lacrymans var. lacrymans S7.3]|uniref:SEC7 domain-containing protein n=2 Tax=Serpula lacrymans var. lacrymans TaxID=341189 RepID=F8PZH1_SERL3|nr:uncharacterized protein SERLADRAFT_356614 [Serpula lacrymans var. lacrymans S7.9]EGN98293.1 hypothetical protein SERLA73DRAFT_91578 [Serpula lacrymans var. lacrymans S7.3]EGO23863.1 hypothetical protein SERLADRAFT_356614 [Serpula lacrymans var. lacrymans S7.9]